MTTFPSFFLHVLYVSFLFFLLSAKGYSAASDTLTNDYSIDQFTATDGFVSSEIYSIIQDQQGFIWFGTAENGVMRYDGKNVKLYEASSDAVKGLSHNDAGNLMLDKNGNIWVGTWGGGVNKYSPTTGKFQRFLHDPDNANSISSNRVQSLFHDKTGDIWLGTYNKGLNRYLGNGKFQRVQREEDSQVGLSHNRIWDIIDNDEKTLWVATSYGLNLLNKDTLTATYYFPDKSNETATGANEVRSLLLASDGRFYVATQEGPFLFLPESGVFIPQLTKDGKALGQVNSMIEDHEGIVWFVTTNGLFRRSQSDNEVQKTDFGFDNGLRIIFEDHTHTKWITSEVHGIFKLSPRRKVKIIDSELLVAPNGIELDENGDVLIVNAKAEVYKWKTGEQRLHRVSNSVFSSFDDYAENGVIERPIILPIENNRFWVAQDDFLVRFDAATKDVTRVEYPKDDAEYRHFREFRALALDDNDNLWIGTYKNGVYVYNNDSNTFEHLTQKDGLPHPETLAIFKDRDGNMWVGTGKGVSVWREDEKRFDTFSSTEKNNSLLGNIVEDIYQSRNGNIWVATQKGLNLYQPDTQSFKRFSEQQGLPAPLIRAVSDGENEGLWLTTNKGIFLYDPYKQQALNYNSSSKFAGQNYYSSSLLKSSQGTFFTSSQRGIEYFNYEKSDQQELNANIVLTDFSVMGEPASTDTPLSYVKDVYLSHEDYFFSFEFALLDLSAATVPHFAYKLEGYDEQWIDIGNYNNVSFTNLNGGTYTLLVRALKQNGEWSSAQLAVNVHVESKPWKTWWAYTLYGVLLTATVMLIIYLRTRLHQTEITKQKRFVQVLEQQVSEKTASLELQARELKVALNKAEEATKLKSEFLANMSHEIRTPLNGVVGMLSLLKNSGLNAEQAHQANIANSSANSLLVLINDILDFSKIEADKLDIESVDFDLRALIEELAYSIAHTAQEKGLEVIVDVSKVQTSKVNSDPNRIKQILNNLLSNAVKFTELGEISITAELLPHKDANCYLMRCVVEDTGIGIEKHKLEHLFESFTQVDASTTRRYGGTGLGLTITKKLCELLGGDVRVSSDIGSGSCFEVTCEVKKVNEATDVLPTIENVNHHCLIVAPNLSSQRALEKQLNLWGAQTSLASTAKSALSVYEESIVGKSPITIILFDKTTPDMAAASFCHAIRTYKTPNNPRVVTMTLLKDLDSAQQAKEFGLYASFPKPLSINALRFVLEDEPSSSSHQHHQHHHKQSGEERPSDTQDDYIGSSAENNNSSTYSLSKGAVSKDAVSKGAVSEGPHILLVEDNAINQIVATSIIEGAGFIVDVANNGKEAIELLQAAGEDCVYSLIVMDCQMPEMDGFEATRQIRKGTAGAQYHQVPIVAMTANAMQSDKEMCMKAGMDDFLTKPIEQEKVIVTLRKWLQIEVSD
ncbi:hybrid sensor histidine kinase/response regulator [Alteromonas hispanica]|uniref:Sensory/regulatory protein RpfC n=1 Tax=Alteromonas hispanica TaxID=315421 RepID=A0A6L9MRX4_9ALTE|nr:hybrid sensor histidine kinase/response regulator [Alteromonas hispanica]NDW20928.1 response regulator [Alteromonas hispanica]